MTFAQVFDRACLAYFHGVVTDQVIQHSIARLLGTQGLPGTHLASAGNELGRLVAQLLDERVLRGNRLDGYRAVGQLAGFTGHHVLQVHWQHVVRRIRLNPDLVSLLGLQAAASIFDKRAKVPLRRMGCWLGRVQQAKLAVCTLFPHFIKSALSGQGVLALLRCRLPALHSDQQLIVFGGEHFFAALAGNRGGRLLIDALACALGHFFEALQQWHHGVLMKVLRITGGPGVHPAAKGTIKIETFLQDLIALGLGGDDFRQAELGEQGPVDFDPQIFCLALQVEPGDVP